MNRYGSQLGIFIISLLLVSLSVSAHEPVYIHTSTSDRISEGYDRDVNMVIHNNVGFIAAGEGGVKILDVSDASDPYIIGHFDATYASHLALSGDILVISTADTYLYFVDVSNPTNPELIAEKSTLAATQGIAIHQNMVYVAGSNAGVTVFNITDFQNPEYVNNYYMGGLQIYDVSIYNNLAILATSEGVSINNVSSITVPLDTFGISNLFTVELRDNFIYAYALGSFTVLNITNSNTLNLLDSYAFTYSFGGRVNGTTAYVADNQDVGIHLLDISDPTNISYTGSIPIFFGVYDIQVQENYIYVLKGEYGLQVFDVDGTVATEVNALDTGSDWYTSISYSEQNGHLYTLSKYDGLKIFNIDTNGNFSQLGVYRNPEPIDEMEINGNHAYLTQGNNFNYLNMTRGIRIVNFPDPTSPSEISFLNVSSRINDIEVIDDYMLVATNGNLSLVDISDKASPQMIMNISSTEYTNILHDGNYLYLSTPVLGMTVLDISNITNPIELGNISTPNFFNIEKYGDFVFGSTNDGFVMLDVSQPNNPQVAGEYMSGQYLRGISVFDHFLFVLHQSSDNKISIYDISRPYTPELIGRHYVDAGLVASLQDITITENHFMVTLERYGLHSVNWILQGDHSPNQNSTEVTSIINNQTYVETISEVTTVYDTIGQSGTTDEGILFPDIWLPVTSALVLAIIIVRKKVK